MGSLRNAARHTLPPSHVSDPAGRHVARGIAHWALRTFACPVIRCRSGHLEACCAPHRGPCNVRASQSHRGTPLALRAPYDRDTTHERQPKALFPIPLRVRRATFFCSAPQRKKSAPALGAHVTCTLSGPSDVQRPRPLLSMARRFALRAGVFTRKV
jgi:hypothetical protein